MAHLKTTIYQTRTHHWGQSRAQRRIGEETPSLLQQRAAGTAAPHNGRDRRDRMARFPRMESRHLGGLRLLQSGGADEAETKCIVAGRRIGVVAIRRPAVSSSEVPTSAPPHAART